MHAWQGRKDHNGVPQDLKKSVIFLGPNYNVGTLALLSRVAQDWNGMMGAQSVPNSTLTPPLSKSLRVSVPLLPSPWPSFPPSILKHHPGILRNPFHLFPLLRPFTHGAVAVRGSHSKAALCGEPQSFVSRKEKNMQVVVTHLSTAESHKTIHFAVVCWGDFTLRGWRKPHSKLHSSAEVCLPQSK